MTRERIVGFLLGISVGTMMGFYLRPGPAQANPQENAGKRAEADEKKPVNQLARARRTN